MDPKKSGADPTIRQSKSALLEAAQAAVADQKQRGKPGASSTGRRGGLRALLVLLMVGGSVPLLLRPEWLVGRRIPAETPQVRVASATLSLVEAISHIKDYLEKNGRLPASPSEAGVTNPAIELRRLDGDQFEVQMIAGDSTVTLRSTDSLKARVVDAVITLQRRS